MITANELKMSDVALIEKGVKASSLDETQWNRGRRSAVIPRFRFATSRLRIGIKAL